MVIRRLRSLLLYGVKKHATSTSFKLVIFSLSRLLEYLVPPIDHVDDIVDFKAARVSDYGGRVGRILNSADNHAQLFKEKDFKNEKFVNNLLKWYWKLRDQGPSLDKSTSGFKLLTRIPQNRKNENGYGFNSKKELELEK